MFDKYPFTTVSISQQNEKKFPTKPTMDIEEFTRLLCDTSIQLIIEESPPEHNFFTSEFTLCNNSPLHQTVTDSNSIEPEITNLNFFHLEQQPEAFQRRSYPHTKRKEMRHFKPQVLKLVPRPEIAKSIQYGTAVMTMVDENMLPAPDQLPETAQMNLYKSFYFSPMAFSSSKGKHYRLFFTVNFVLENGENKTETVLSKKFRVVSRITSKHQAEMAMYK
mmetsp:Transcript_2612/g.3470  ORF Transcript_2612/g.3470 Transcript_2612/m.3470 type:complete len:220 (-) Transcript_2612:39-698(-)